EKGYGLAHLLTDGSTLLAQRIDGTLDLIRADPKGFRRLDSAEVAKTTVRAQPALSDGVLYLRTTPGGGDGEVFALRLSP
ncbi:MAG: Pyrrolo-quinoline quinone, partial [Acidobacteriota bacterium]